MNEMSNSLNNCRLLMFLGVLWLACTLGPPALAQPDGLSVEPFDGPFEEHYVYDLDFIFFKKLAEGELKLEKTDQPDVYRAELIGRTLGVAAWLTGDRTQRYIAFMQKQADGSLHSLSYESQIIKRKSGRWSTKRKRMLFDESHHKVFLEKAKNGNFVPDKHFELLEGQFPVDILTGFYNLRAGFYGSLLPGRHLEIPTITGDGLTVIKVDVLTVAQQKKKTFFPAGGKLLQITLDPEVFETTDGGMYLWFDGAGLPARGVVEDVIGLGDANGYLRKELHP